MRKRKKRKRNRKRKRKRKRRERERQEKGKIYLLLYKRAKVFVPVRSFTFLLLSFHFVFFKEVGSLVYMDDGVEMETSTGGGLMKSFKGLKPKKDNLFVSKIAFLQ